MTHKQLEIILKKELGDVKEFISYFFSMDLDNNFQLYDVTYKSINDEIKEYSVIVENQE